MKRFMKAGRVFTVNELGQAVDEDGFCTSAGTCNYPICKTCVSVKINKDTVQVRDTKDSNKTTLPFNHDEWRLFIKGEKAGEFDL